VAEAAIPGIATGWRAQFRRGAAHRQSVASVRGLLSDVERKHGSPLAE